VMLVSHDRALLRAVCDEFWLVARGGIEPFDGDLDDYQRYLLDVAKQSREAQRVAARAEAAAPVAAPAPVKQDAQRRQQTHEKTRPLKKELEQVDKRLAALQTEKAQLEDKLMGVLSPADMATTGKRLKAVSDEVETLESRWLELTDAIEAATAG